MSSILYRSSIAGRNGPGGGIIIWTHNLSELFLRLLFTHLKGH